MSYAQSKLAFHHCRSLEAVLDAREIAEYLDDNGDSFELFARAFEDGIEALKLRSTELETEAIDWGGKGGGDGYVLSLSFCVICHTPCANGQKCIICLL